MKPYKTLKNQRFSENQRFSRCSEIGNFRHFVPRKFYKFSRKSQMEILGLAIVVILMLIGTFFVVRFLVFKTPSDYRKGFLSSELASSMINVFLRIDDNACSQPMADLVRNCMESGSVCCGDCESGSGINSCMFVENAANDIFSRTLEEWKYKYEFLIYQDAYNPKIIRGSKCVGERKSESYSISSSSGPIYVKLDICG